MKRFDERGAVAVEFALVLPVLLLLLLGIVEFGHAYNAQISLTHAAREGARVMAIQNKPGEARLAAKSAAVGLNPQLADADFSSLPLCPLPTSANPAPTVTMTITYEVDTITGIAGPFELKGIGVMRCGG